MATSPIPTANHGLASPPSLTQIPVPPKFDFPPPFIPTTTPSLPDNQSLHLPPNFPSMPQQLTELQHPAVSVPIAQRNSQHNMFVPPVAYPSLPSPNVNYPFQTQPVFVIGYFFNPNTCIPKVAASPVQTSIPPDCNSVYVAGSNAISHDGSNGSTCVLPAATSSSFEKSTQRGELTYASTFYDEKVSYMYVNAVHAWSIKKQRPSLSHPFSVNVAANI